MLEVLFGILGVIGDILAPTPAVRTFWAVVAAMGVVALIAFLTHAPR